MGDTGWEGAKIGSPERIPGWPANVPRNATTPCLDFAVRILTLPYGFDNGLQALRGVGVRYVLMSGGGDLRQSMRRFAAEVMPAFTPGI